MKNARLTIWVIVAAMLCTHQAFASTVEIREYLLGDMDSFHHDGPGSVDDVHVDSIWLSWVEASTAQPIHNFDSVSADHHIPFTFQCELASSRCGKPEL